MRRFGKRLGAWVLCIAMLCTLPVMAMAASVEDCPGDCTHQAAIGTIHFDTIEEAFAAAIDEDTVTVLADISAAALTIDKEITLDLNGKTITGQNTIEEALLMATKDLTVTGGTLLTENGAVLLVIDAVLTVEESASVQAEGTAIGIIARSVDAEASAKISGEVIATSGEPAIGTVSDNGNDCDLYIDKTAVIISEGNAIEMYDAGNLEITGGTITAKENTVVMDVYTGLTMEAAVTGGTFTAENGELFVITARTDATAPEAFITGGTYNRDPSEFVADHCVVLDNGDGTYTVVSFFTLTFLSGGADGSMAPVTVRCGESYTLPECGFIHDDNMEFAGWKIGGSTYAVGDTFTPVSDTVITALWSAHEHYGGHATCISPAICDGCGSTYGDYGSHEFTYVDGYAATCDSTGMLSYYQCVYCGTCYADGVEISSFSLITPALGHQWKNEKAKAATCTEAGLQEHRICTTCGSIQIDGKYADQSEVEIPALGHTLKDIDAVPSTCTQAGVQAHSHCTTCDKRFQQNKEVDLAQLTTVLASHVLGTDYITDETYHWKTCVDCSEVFLQSKHTDADTDNVCDHCGYTMTAASQPTEVNGKESVTGKAAATEKEEKDRKGLLILLLIPVFLILVIAVYLIVEKYNRHKRRKMRQMRKMSK